MHPVHAVDTVERATLAAVPPDAVEEFDGWLLGLDAGTVGRAHSAVPLHHRTPSHSALPAIEARYRAHGLKPVFRLPVVPAFEDFAHALRERGYVPTGSPVRVMLGTPADMARAAAPDGVVLRDQADDAWARIYLGEGFDAVDGASRVRLLRRAREATYASVTAAPAGGLPDEVAAVGCACFSHGLVGVHGMRTRPAFRGRGLARRLLAAMGRSAMQRGIEQAFLQVEADNEAAGALYARCGFATAWTYGYWRVGAS